jgi:hypothetical protein
MVDTAAHRSSKCKFDNLITEDQVGDLAKALSELGIDEMGPLTRDLAKVQIEPDLYWNDSERRENCVWVSTARYYRLPVSELERQVGMTAPGGGAVQSQIMAFIRAIQRWDCNTNGTPAVCVLGRGEFPHPDSEMFIVCYERANGTRHCVLQEGERFFCYQFFDAGLDVTQEVRAPGVKIILSWMFMSPRHAGACTPVSTTTSDSGTSQFKKTEGNPVLPGSNVDLIARIYPYADYLHYAKDAILSNHNRSRWIPPSDDASGISSDDEGSISPDDEGGISPCLSKPGLQLSFSHGPKGPLGFMLGRDARHCDIVLPHLPGISRQHCYLTFDYQRRLIVNDISSYGTIVTYDGMGGERRRNFTWIIGGDVIADRSHEVVLQIHEHLRFLIVVSWHREESELYSEKVDHFLKRLTENDKTPLIIEFRSHSVTIQKH